WLYQVAVRVALRARGQAAARRRHECCAPCRQPPDPLAEMTGRELLAALDEELHALPADYRDPLVLCYLEGKTRDEAARQLGCSPRTLPRGLEAGKSRLHARLVRRGLTLGTGLQAAGFGHQATAALPPALARSTVRAVLASAALGTGSALRI